MKGSKFPLRLYTIYVNENLKPDKAEKDMSMKEKRKFYANKKEKLKEEIANKNGTKFIYQHSFLNNPHLITSNLSKTNN